MNDIVRTFIEVNVDLLESNATEFFHIAYNGLSKYHQCRLVEVLTDAGIDTYAAREAVLRYIVTMTFEDLADKMLLRAIVSRMLDGTLGFKFDELFNYILDNESEWNNPIRLENGMYFVYPVDH